MLLSIAMIVKNEEENLDRCLKAIKVLDNILNYEIVIVDTGSEDETVNIARKYTNKVYEHAWNNDFAAMRNVSIGYCQGEWILILDADEVLESSEELVKFFKDKKNKKFNSATIKFKNMLSDKEADYIIGSLVRLFKNVKNFCYEGRVHEQPKILAPTALTNITLVHYGYSRTSYKLMEYKYNRNLKLLLKDLEEGKDLIYTYFQLAQTYGMANKNEKALESIAKAFKLVQEHKNKGEFLYVYHFMAMKLASMGYNEEAIKISEEAIKLNDEHLDFYYVLAKSNLTLNIYDKMNIYIEKYLTLHKKLENGYIVQDIRVNNTSYCKKEEILKDKIIVDFKNKDFKHIIKNYEELKNSSYKDQLKEIYMYVLVKEMNYKKFRVVLKDKKMEDGDIGSIISVVEQVHRDKLAYGEISEVKSIYEKLINLDKRLDSYIKLKFDDCIIEEINIDFSEYYPYKAEIFKEYLLKDRKYLNLLERLKNNDQLNYIQFVISDYECLEILNQYSKEKFLEIDIRVLNLLTKIEDVLIRNESINSEEYMELIKRAYVNKLKYIELIYNINAINGYSDEILTRSELMCIKLKEAIDYYENNQLEYIRLLRKILKDFPEYKKLIEMLTTKVSPTTISEVMIEEKNKILDNVQMLINENMLDDAEIILKEIGNLFIYDGDIKSYMGIVKYLKGDSEKALLDLALSMKFSKDKFEATYNIATILSETEEQGKAKYYYEEACKICNDDKVKEEINNILRNN